ncbi:MAG: 2-oxo acid dehydrogenase subunit E2 [Alphaproteobacteria bacterium]|nr:2-oxo acid dehydrogenase subunit E2 [Alphaproteobacteria bacterium]
MAGLTDVLLPKLGLTMKEGRLAEWRVTAGQPVRKGDVLFVVETDKIATEIEAPADGEMREILVEAGETVPVGMPVARWTGPGLAVGDGTGEAAPASPPPQSKPPAPREGERRVVATPLARRVARQRGIDLARVAGSGPSGRIKAIDIERAAAAPGAAPGTAPGTASPAVGASFAAGPTPVRRRRPASRVEAAMARRLVAAKRDIPHFYLSMQAEISRLLAIKEELAGAPGMPRLTLNTFVVLALGRALADMPEANALWEDDAIVELGRVDVAIAMQTDAGLLVPVLRDVPALGLEGVARAAAALAEKARAGNLALDDMAGGAVCVSNLGMHGVAAVAPIVNPPQAAILGVGAVQELFRPGPGGAPDLRREITLTLAADHRVLDGVRAAGLLRRVARHLERPALLLRTAA